MRTLNIECKTLNKKGEIEIFKSVDLYDSLFEYASRHTYAECPDHGPDYDELPKNFHIFPLEYWPVNERYFRNFNPEHNIIVDGVEYSQVDCGEADGPNSENHSLSYIPHEEIYKNLFTLSIIIRDEFGCCLTSKAKVYRSFEDAEKEIPEAYVALNYSLIDKLSEVETLIEIEEKRREAKKREWNDEIEGFYYVILLIIRGDMPLDRSKKLVGIGKTTKEALFDARDRIEDQFPNAFRNLAWWILGKNYFEKLSEEFPGQYDPNDNTAIKMDSSVWLECWPAFISKKAYNAIIELGYDIQLFDDDCVERTKASVIRLPGEVDEYRRPTKNTTYHPYMINFFRRNKELEKNEE
jgi:hypothetical protein